MEQLGLSKNKLKYLQTLKLKKYRQKYGSFLAEGRKVVLELIKHNSFNIKGIYALRSWIIEHKYILENISIPTYEINEKELTRISSFKTPDAVCIELEMNGSFGHDIISGGWVLYLDQLNDPGNIGTIFRTADWFGVSAIYLAPGSADVYNAKAVHATMGSIGKVPFNYREIGDIIKSYPDWPLYLTGMTGDSAFDHVFPEKGILVIGNESHGLSSNLMNFEHTLITIPKGKGRTTESLNAGVASGILISTICRTD